MLFRSMIRSDTAGMQVTINLAARRTQYNLLRLTAECGSDVDGRLYATVLRTKRIANRTAAERPAVKICTPSCLPIACDSRLPFSHHARRRGRGSTIPPQWRDSESLPMCMWGTSGSLLVLMRSLFSMVSSSGMPNVTQHATRMH